MNTTEMIEAMTRPQLMATINQTRAQIALAKERRAGLQRAIDSRETYLARLQAQLVLTSPASQTATRIAG